MTDELDTDDFNYDELDPGIRETVHRLHELGYTTTDSGDGKAKVGQMGCAMGVPNVVIQVTDPTELTWVAMTLFHELEAAGIRVQEISEDDECVSIQASFDPVSGVATILLLGLDDAGWPDKA